MIVGLVADATAVRCGCRCCSWTNAILIIHIIVESMTKSLIFNVIEEIRKILHDSRTSIAPHNKPDSNWLSWFFYSEWNVLMMTPIDLTSRWGCDWIDQITTYSVYTFAPIWYDTLSSHYALQTIQLIHLFVHSQLLIMNCSMLHEVNSANWFTIERCCSDECRWPRKHNRKKDRAKVPWQPLNNCCFSFQTFFYSTFLSLQTVFIFWWLIASNANHAQMLIEFLTLQKLNEILIVDITNWYKIQWVFVWMNIGGWRVWE